MIVFVVVFLVAVPHAANAIAIGLTTTSLLSGSTLTSCNAVQINVTGKCTAGLASVMQIVRWLEERNGTRVVPFPLIDRQTAFVQMHPLTWAVNMVAMERLGVPYGYMTVPSLFTARNVQHPERWRWFHNSTRLRAMASNVEVPPSDAWFDHVARTQIFDGVGLITLLENASPNTLPVGPVLLAAVRALRLRADVTTVVVYLFDGSLTAEMILREARDALLEGGPFGDEEESWASPDVIISTSATSSTLTTAAVSNGTLVLSLQPSASLLHVINITHGNPLGTTVWTENLVIPPATGDSTYYAHQAFLNELAASAATNDPVLGHTVEDMPAHRAGNVRICLSGECPIGRMFANAFREKGLWDVGLTSSGGFRGPGWPAGPFRVSDVWAAMPFANAYCHGKIRGVTLWKMLNYSTALSTAPSPYLTSYGDRLLQLAGIHITFNANYTSSRLLSVNILNRETGRYEPLDRLKLYSYGTDSFLANVFEPFPHILRGSRCKRHACQARCGTPRLQRACRVLRGRLLPRRRHCVYR